MDAAGVGMAVLSLTGPNVYWGDAEASSQAARAINDSFSQAHRAYPDRIRWLCSLPMQFPENALVELDRCVKLGALGVMALANIGGAAWTDPLFAPVWKELDRRALPVFMHPTVPCGADLMGMADYQPLTATSGNLVGLCPKCGGTMYRRVSHDRLAEAAGKLDIQFMQAREHIDESGPYSVNRDFSTGV